MNKKYVPKEKRPYVERGNNLIKRIRELEAEEPQNALTKQKIKNLYDQFNVVFDYVFEK